MDKSIKLNLNDKIVQFLFEMFKVSVHFIGNLSFYLWALKLNVYVGLRDVLNKVHGPITTDIE